jgi:uncharacterized membrane protein
VKATSIFLIFLILFSSPYVLALSKMLVSVSVNHFSTDFGELIVITGKVSNEAGYPIQNALISIQVNNPNGSVIHVALVYSSRNGTFKDEFSLSSDAPEGNYSVYIIASKAGYEDFQTKISLSFFFSDFLIAASPNIIELKQGEKQQILISLIPSKPLNITVLLQVSNAPKGIKYSLNQTFITPFKSSELTIEASKEAEAGRYNVTIVGAGGGKVKYANIMVTVVKNELNLSSISVLTISFAIAFVLTLLVFLRKVKRGKESKFDRKYLAYARALARIEELKAQGKISDEEYEKLREEYEEKLKKEKH